MPACRQRPPIGCASSKGCTPISRPPTASRARSSSPSRSSASGCTRAAIRAAEEKRLDLAIQLLDAVVELAPDYAEGWNRRALVHYMRDDYALALGDLRRALALEPNHFKALDGLVQILREMGEKKAALKALQQLLAIHPHWQGGKQTLEELSREVEGQGI
jgi:tetratricopeptide (TPR) repeat protein